MLACTRRGRARAPRVITPCRTTKSLHTTPPARRDSLCRVCLGANFNNRFVFVDAKVDGVVGSIDYYNVMSYVWSPTGDFQRAKSAVAAIHAAGFPKAKINMGVAFYDHGSQDYCSLVRSCANASCTRECTAPASNTCNGKLVDGAHMQTAMGTWVAQEGWGGVLIFQVNYDHENLLLNALGAGLAAGSQQRAKISSSVISPRNYQ